MIPYLTGWWAGCLRLAGNVWSHNRRNLEEKGPFKFVDICICSQILDIFCDDELQLAMNPVESDIETYLVKEETYLVKE